MRQYKFRGKRIIDGKWAYGSLLQSEIATNGHVRCAIVERFADCYNIGLHEVNPDTVGLYTCIKDKKEKEIFEGDIVQFKSIDSFDYNEDFDYEKYSDTPISAVMAWNDDACGYRASFNSRFKITKTMLEVIGNIHDNPELLNPAAGISGTHHMTTDPREPGQGQEEATQETQPETLPETEKGQEG